MEWKPIDLAPIDGTPILCYSSDCDDKAYPIHVVRWFEGEWVCQVMSDFVWKPSHWMELPPAPKKQHCCYMYGINCYSTETGLVIKTSIDDKLTHQVYFCPICGEKA